MGSLFANKGHGGAGANGVLFFLYAERVRLGLMLPLVGRSLAQVREGRRKLTCGVRLLPPALRGRVEPIEYQFGFCVMFRPRSGA